MDLTSVKTGQQMKQVTVIKNNNNNLVTGWFATGSQPPAEVCTSVQCPGPGLMPFIIIISLIIISLFLSRLSQLLMDTNPPSKLVSKFIPYH